MGMTRKLELIFCAVVLLAASALMAAGAGVNFSPSTYNPAVGEEVTFEVCQTCLGAEPYRFEWDFDGDGAMDLEVAVPTVTRTFTESGEAVVTLEATDAGWRTSLRKKGLLVGESPLLAVREVLAEDRGGYLVVVTLTVRGDFSGFALEERVPRGWQMQEVDRGGAAYVAQAGQFLEVLWITEIEAGEGRVYAYRLVPSTYASGIPELFGVASGYLKEVPTGEAGKRVKVTVCGDLMIPE